MKTCQYLGLESQDGRLDWEIEKGPRKTTEISTGYNQKGQDSSHTSTTEALADFSLFFLWLGKKKNRNHEWNGGLDLRQKHKFGTIIRKNKKRQGLGSVIEMLPLY